MKRSLIMTEFANLLLISGRAAVEVALFILLPVMIVMLTLMRLLEAKGILDRVVTLLSPVLRPLGIPGLGVFALLQVLFVSFAAPLATLTMMDRGGTNRRHLAATLALVFGSAQANVVFPLSAKGLNGPFTLVVSSLAAIVGAAATYYIFACKLENSDEPPAPKPGHVTVADAKGVIDVINRAGKEAFEIAIGSLPMLVLSLLLGNLLRTIGAIELIEGFSAPLAALLKLPPDVEMPVITKAIDGGTAMMGVVVDMLQQGLLTSVDVNRIAGLLIHPFDLVGIVVLISAGPRVASVLRPAICGAVVAIFLRAAIHLLV
jgi:spore maturation protein SpmB